ncbi:caspase-8-like isoform 1-T1 [Anomaloglossus baeobatrachus]
MDKAFRATELNISNALSKKEILAMIFLCGKYLHERDKDNITDGTALFSILERKGLHSKDNLLFLKELLSRIGRNDILKSALKATKCEMEQLERSFQYISSYRSLLYDISENLLDAETDNIMHLAEPEIKNIRKINEKKCMMIVFSEMEKKGKLSEDDLDTVHSYLEAIHRTDLCEKIEKFKDEQYNQRLDLDSKLQKMAIQEATGAEQNAGSIQPDVPNEPSLKNNVLETYKLEKVPHGRCIILNNHDFSEARSNNIQMKDRNGTQMDAAFASFEDYESLRNPKTGSVYIQTLCTVLQDELFFKMDLTSILTKVQEKIADEEHQKKKYGPYLNVKQMPTYQSTLRKMLILPTPSNGQQATL